MCRVLGKGTCFDDVEQLSKMSKSMAQATFHKFRRHFAAEMFDEHIYLPTGTYLDEVMGIFHQLGCTGACGSTDVTHIGWNMCPFTLGRPFTGKEGFPTIAYEVTVDHAGRTLAVANGFTGATNDKTTIRYDSGVNNIRTEYKLRQGERHRANAPRMVIDGGQRVPRGCGVLLGILKGRFRILKLRMPYHKREYIDNIFFTCCILHNMLHTFDGLDVFEENTDWPGSAGHLDAREHALAHGLHFCWVEGSAAATEGGGEGRVW
ncbi:unnamed protein product [Ectocarpus sp. CCAP 1310/34]|nr:unnamed protein product [Ectocarpus sp. CCAP 1310/34]